MKKLYEKDPAEKTEKESGGPTPNSLRNWRRVKIILGAYLIYLAWKISAGIFGGQAKDQILLLGIAAGVFAVFGAVMMIWNIRSEWRDRTPNEEGTLSKK